MRSPIPSGKRRPPIEEMIPSAKSEFERGVGIMPKPRFFLCLRAGFHRVGLLLSGRFRPRVCASTEKPANTKRGQGIKSALSRPLKKKVTEGSAAHAEGVANGHRSLLFLIKSVFR